MPVILLLLGVVTAAAGLILVASGLPIRDGAFDTEVVTPGMIAAVGGLLLVGMALTLRQLQRIEQSLAVRPMPRPARAAEISAIASDQEADTAVRLPFPPKPKANSQPASAGVAAVPEFADDAAPEMPRAVVEGADVSLLPRAPGRGEEGAGSEKNAATVSRGAGGTAPARAAPRLDVKARPAVVPAEAKGSVLNAFWPGAPRRETRTTALQVAAPQPAASKPDTEAAAGTDAATGHGHEAAVPVSVLKSGVVEGMAYTLYSDGSIEAQLPQGTMRFGSITALREHIESGS